MSLKALNSQSLETNNLFAKHKPKNPLYRNCKNTIGQDRLFIDPQRRIQMKNIAVTEDYSTNVVKLFLSAKKHKCSAIILNIEKIHNNCNQLVS